MKTRIEKIVIDSGLWHGTRRETHQFLLTPDVFPVSASAEVTLRTLGPALTDCLAGLGRIAAVSTNQHLAKNRGWHTVHRMARSGVPRLFRELQMKRPSAPPMVFRIDVVEAEDGRLYVVEIEATKSHGLGYASLFSHVARLGDAKTLPGVAVHLAEQVRQRRIDQTLVLLYADSERFYCPEFEILKRDLALEGVTLVVGSEHEVSVEGDKVTVAGVVVERPLLLGMPIFIGSRARPPNQVAERALAELYMAGAIECLIPPKPFLGSKAMMALLRNDAKDGQIETILASHINPKSLAIVRAVLPETYMVDERTPTPNPNARYVLKDTMSSGAHGITFSDNPRFEDTFSRAKYSGRRRFILQQMIATKRREFRCYPRGSDLAETKQWHTRIGVFYIGRELAEVCVTGCAEPPVHGGKDAIFMGSILT